MALFKLLVGQYIQADPDAPVLTSEQIKAGVKKPSRTYKEGETIESEDDLVAKHGAAKFVLLSGSPSKSSVPAKATPKNDNPADNQPLRELPPTPTSDKETRDRLHRMNVQQLQAFAQEHGINLTGKTTKAEMVEHIMTALSD